MHIMEQLYNRQTEILHDRQKKKRVIMLIGVLLILFWGPIILFSLFEDDDFLSDRMPITLNVLLGLSLICFCNAALALIILAVVGVIYVIRYLIGRVFGMTVRLWGIAAGFVGIVLICLIALDLLRVSEPDKQTFSSVENGAYQNRTNAAELEQLHQKIALKEREYTEQIRKLEAIKRECDELLQEIEEERRALHSQGTGDNE